MVEEVTNAIVGRKRSLNQFAKYCDSSSYKAAVLDDNESDVYCGFDDVAYINSKSEDEYED